MTEIIEAASRDEEEGAAHNQFNFIRSQASLPPMPASFYLKQPKVNHFLPKRGGNDNPWNRKPDSKPRMPVISSITPNTTFTAKLTPI